MAGTVRLRNVSPLGYINVNVIGRVGPAPYYVCPNGAEYCLEKNGPDHEHTEIVDENGAGSPGQGCLVPGEEFEVPKAVGDELLKQEEHFELVKTAPKK